MTAVISRLRGICTGMRQPGMLPRPGTEFLLLSEGVATVLCIPPGASVAGCRPRFRPGPCVFYLCAAC